MKVLSRTAELEKVLNSVRISVRACQAAYRLPTCGAAPKMQSQSGKTPFKGDGASWKPKQIVEWWRRCIQIVTGSFAVMKQCRLEQTREMAEIFTKPLEVNKCSKISKSQ